MLCNVYIGLSVSVYVRGCVYVLCNVYIGLSVSVYVCERESCAL